MIPVLLLSVGFAAAGEAEDRALMTAAWQRIMDDLEKVVHANIETGPGIDASFEAYGMEPEDYVRRLRETAPASAKAELDFLEGNANYKSRRDMYADDYVHKTSREKFNQRMWEQFEKSFNREIRGLSKAAAGQLMAKFGTTWALRPPLFMSPLVFYSWAGDMSQQLKVTKLAQLMIWKTGNPTAIRDFVPTLLTNRMGGFALHDGLLRAAGQKAESHPSSELKGWQKKFPKETEAALVATEEAMANGDLKRSSAFTGAAADTTWRSLPVHEILDAVEGTRTAKCVGGFSAIGK